MRLIFLILSLFIVTVCRVFPMQMSILAFESDELLVDDDEFGLEGGRPHPEILSTIPSSYSSSRSTASQKRHLDPESDSKLHFTLEHAFGDSHFVTAGIFSARLKTWHHGGQTLTKLRFSRNNFSETEKVEFRKILVDDEFYRIRLPSNVATPPGREYIISSVKVRCLTQESLDEHMTIHMEGVNIVALNYASSGSCQYPRQLKLPTNWNFNSHTILKSSEQAPRTPAFVVEDNLIGESVEGEEGVKPAERSLWAKYWMYVIPLGLIVMNVVTQVMNGPEEQQAAMATPTPAAIQRPQTTPAARRR